jgi:pimeloyl-ACP methyl ester carboxylesterase
MSSATPFRIHATDEQLADLQRRLAATRWPERETVDDWSQGVPLAYVREVAAYWLDRYDWRAREARINSFSQFRMPVGRLAIHFIHVRSPHADATPLLLTHGWPGSIVEFLDVIEPLANPEAHGGRACDAFHVVCPSLPGYGYSDKPTRAGCGLDKIARIWDRLMGQLGYSGYIAQGGDWGAAVSAVIGMQNRGRCRALHVTLPFLRPTREALSNPGEAARTAAAKMLHYRRWDSGYAQIQATRPQTLGYALTDSPAGQAAWILEKFWAWTDCKGHPENALTRDQLLDNVMIYWLTATATSSARLYWESLHSIFDDPRKVSLPVGFSLFPKEIVLPLRESVESRFQNVIYWNEVAQGGHFAAFEQPVRFVDELRRFRAAAGQRA